MSVSLPVLRSKIKLALRADLRGCQLSKEAIAEKLSVAVDRTVEVAEIDEWITYARGCSFPLEMLFAWVSVTDSRRLMFLVARSPELLRAQYATQRFAAYGLMAIERQLQSAEATRLERELVELLKLEQRS